MFPFNRKSRNTVSFWVTKARRFKRKTAATNKRRRVKILSIAATLALIGLFLSATLVFGAIIYFSRGLPSPDRLTEPPAQSTKIFARDGTLLYEIFAEERRTLVKLEDIPECMKLATIATEDADFYKHRGFDIKGMLYAFYQIVAHRKLQGGSTITQQLVKNALLTQERTLTRKIKEFILAVQIERRYSKDEILQMFFNETPYGGQAWGIEAASWMYFNKGVKDVNLAEAALLAGLPQSPSYYSPFGAHPEVAKERQSYVLYLMEKHGFITKEEAEEAKKAELKFATLAYNIRSPHFVMYVKEKLVQEFGEALVQQGGLRVTTSLDLNLQTIAEEEISTQLDRLAQAGADATNAGLIAVNPKTGEILSMVGSRDYFDVEHDGNVNVTLAERQPGSSIKPLMYVTAFKMGYTPSTFLSDIRTCWSQGEGKEDFCPVNWDGKYWGPMQIRTALANSRNIPAVKMLQLVGVQNVLDTAHKMGITTLNEPERYGLSLTLGGGEVKPIDMAQAFSVFATLGIKNDLVAILKVEDYKGKILKEFKAKNIGKRVLDEKYAYLINDILSDDAARSRTFGKSFSIGRVVATKTGTTNDNRDAWTIGYTPSLCTVVWVGNFDNHPMRGIMGSTGATPIWRSFTVRALEGQEKEEFIQPEGIVKVTVDALSGKIPQEGKDYPVKTEIFIKGTEPTRIDDFHTTVRVCKSGGLLATDYHEKIGDIEDKTYVVLRELNSDWQSYTDQWMLGSDGYSAPPTEKCPITKDGKEVEEPIVEITSPKDGVELLVYGFDVEVEVFSIKTITKIEFYWDDVLIKVLTSIPYTTTYSLSMNEEGEHAVGVRAYDSEGNVGVAKNTVKLPTKSKVTPSPTPQEEIPTPSPTLSAQ